MRLKKRGQFSWHGWGSHWYHKNWYAAHTPFGGVGVDHHRRVTKPWISRGRCLEWELRIPLTSKWQIHLTTPSTSYLDLVNGPKYLRSIDWILDEFDSSFNALAIASLRYHLDWSVCCNEDRREKYEDIIARLTERQPTFTDEELAILHPPGSTWKDDLRLINESIPERDAVYKAYWQRQEEYDQRLAQARHDFVDIMPYLWS